MSALRSFKGSFTIQSLYFTFETSKLSKLCHSPTGSLNDSDVSPRGEDGTSDGKI